MVFQFAYPFEKITFSSIFKSMPWSMLSVMILSFLTDRSGQTVMTKFKLLLEMQPDQCLHCLLFHLHLLEALLHSTASKFVLRVLTATLLGIQILGFNYMRRVTRKPAFCIRKNKGADQLHSNHTTDQHLCYHYMEYYLSNS